jgi:hypothetical protein
VDNKYEEKNGASFAKKVEVGHEINLEQLEQSKIDPKEVMTFHNGEQKK